MKCHFLFCTCKNGFILHSQHPSLRAPKRGEDPISQEALPHLPKQHCQHMITDTQACDASIISCVAVVWKLASCKNQREHPITKYMKGWAEFLLLKWNHRGNLWETRWEELLYMQQDEKKNTNNFFLNIFKEWKQGTPFYENSTPSVLGTKWL